MVIKAFVDNNGSLTFPIFKRATIQRSFCPRIDWTASTETGTPLLNWFNADSPLHAFTYLTTLFISRIIEGLGLGVIAVVAPALISMWFPPEKRGLPMGIWGAWQMVAQSATFFLGEYLTLDYGWQGMWWFGVSLCLLSFILYGLKVASPPGELNYADVETVDVSIWEGFKSPSVWLLAGAVLFFLCSLFWMVYMDSTFLERNLWLRYRSSQSICWIRLYAGNTHCRFDRMVS